VGTLARALMAALPDATITDEANVERVLSAAAARGRRAWPQLALTDEQFVRHLAPRLVSGRDPIVAIEGLRAEELFLACACAHGDPAAVAALEQHYMPAAHKAVMGIDTSQDARAEALQRLRARLFVGENPAIAQYAGVGSLEGWVRVTAVRTALNTLRGARREVSARDSLLAAVGSSGVEPELELVKQRYRGELEQATVRAFEQLPDEQRELLRLYVVDGLTLEELARIHEVNASTVSRWLLRIRDKIAADARRHFAERCDLPASECESLVRAVQSEMHVSVARLLA